VRVQRAVLAWEKYTKGMRQRRKQMLAHYANGWFSSEGRRSSIPLNLIDRGVQIIVPLLVSKNPKVMIQPRAGTNNPYMRAFANTLELALAHLFDEIKFEQYTLRPLVFDALFGMGITKTGVSHSHKVEIGGYLHDVGQPYCDRIDFDDYIGDVAARNRQEMKLEGHWYRLPERYVKESGLYKNYDKLSTEVSLYGKDETRPEAIAKREAGEYPYRDLTPMVELCDIWLPDEGIVITLPREGQGDKIIREVEWDGPEGGPFDILAFRYFPSSVIPIPPIYTWLDINKTVNVIVNKMRDQVEREKSIGVYELSAAEDATRLKGASHGELVGLENTDGVKEITFGGFNEKSFPFLQFLLYQWSQTGPNLDVTGGRRVDAPTLGQEQMMQANAARELDDMVHQMYEVTKSIVRKLAWFLWTDPLIVIPLIKRVAGQDLHVEYSEAAKEGDFFDYSFDIEPYSMMRMNPEMRYQRLMQFVSQYILPTAQIAAAQGRILNVPELAKDFARYLNITNLDDWYKAIIPNQVGLNPYSPVQGTVSPKQSGISGTQSSEASNMNNTLRQQASLYSEAQQGQTVRGM